MQLSGRHHSTHQVLTGAGHAWCDVEVVPANEQEEEEGQHEQLPKPDCQHKYLRERERDGIKQGMRIPDSTVGNAAHTYTHICISSNITLEINS